MVHKDNLQDIDLRYYNREIDYAVHITSVCPTIQCGNESWDTYYR